MQRPTEWITLLLLLLEFYFLQTHGAAVVVRCSGPTKGLGVATFLGDCTGVGPNTTCLFVCRNNFRPKYETKLTCMPDGTWDRTTAECEALKCNDDRMDGVSWTRFCDLRPGEECQDNSATGPQCVCKQGFSRTSAAHTCISTVKCPEPSKGAGVSRFLGECAGASPNTTCQFVCLNNSEAVGGNKLTCQADGTWDKQARCQGYPPEVFCPEPLPNPGVTLEGNCDRLAPGSECRFKCPSRFRPLNGGKLTCLHDGAWDARAQCQADRCYDLKEVGLTWSQFCERVLRRQCVDGSGLEPKCGECQVGFADIGSAACAGQECQKLHKDLKMTWATICENFNGFCVEDPVAGPTCACRQGCRLVSRWVCVCQPTRPI